MIGITEIPPGVSAWAFFFTTQDPATGSQGNPDNVVGRLFATDGASNVELTNGVDLDWAVTGIDTGIYALTVGNDLVTYPPGAVITAMVQTTWGLITQIAPIAMFSIGPPLIWASVVADAGNTVNAFKVTTTGTSLSGTNALKNCLAVPVSGACLTEGPRKVTGFNFGTGFMTVDPPFENVPQENDRFIYVFR